MGVYWAPFGILWVPFGCLLDPFGYPLDPFGYPFGPLWDHFGGPWPPLGTILVTLASFWGPLTAERAQKVMKRGVRMLFSEFFDIFCEFARKQDDHRGAYKMLSSEAIIVISQCVASSLLFALFTLFHPRSHRRFPVPLSLQVYIYIYILLLIVPVLLLVTSPDLECTVLRRSS